MVEDGIEQQMFNLELFDVEMDLQIMADRD